MPSPASGAGLPQLRRHLPDLRPARLLECFGPLEVDYDQAELAKVTRSEIEAGPQLWRYARLLPVGVHPGDRVSRPRPDPAHPRRAPGQGPRDAQLWVKDDSANPTHSFKDRVVSTAVSAAIKLGFDRFACASTGNLGELGGRSRGPRGVPSIVFIPHDLEPGKIVQSAIYGGTLVACRARTTMSTGCARS